MDVLNGKSKIERITLIMMNSLQTTFSTQRIANPKWINELLFCLSFGFHLFMIFSIFGDPLIRVFFLER